MPNIVTNAMDTRNQATEEHDTGGEGIQIMRWQVGRRYIPGHQSWQHTTPRIIPRDRW